MNNQIISNRPILNESISNSPENTCLEYNMTKIINLYDYVYTEFNSGGITDSPDIRCNLYSLANVYKMINTYSAQLPIDTSLFIYHYEAQTVILCVIDSEYMDKAFYYVGNMSEDIEGNIADNFQYVYDKYLIPSQMGLFIMTDCTKLGIYIDLQQGDIIISSRMFFDINEFKNWVNSLNVSTSVKDTLTQVYLILDMART